MGLLLLSVVVLLNVFCLFFCILGLFLFFCFLIDLVIIVVCLWKLFFVRNEKRKIFYLI